MKYVFLNMENKLVLFFFSVIGIPLSLEYPPPPKPIKYYVDRPFSYYIKQDGVVLFAGRVHF